MFYLLVLLTSIVLVTCTENFTCQNFCPDDHGVMTCGFCPDKRVYKMFPSFCAMEAYALCHRMDFTETPLHFCIKHHNRNYRKMYGESCPVFCPRHWSPVCGANLYKSYIYKTFDNGCYLDMVNCRGDDSEFAGYAEVPLEYCQRHLMKNMFRETIVITNTGETNPYIA